MPELPFIDAHVHLWKLDRLRYPWLAPPFADDGPNGNVAAIARDYLLDDYLADAKQWNVVGMVHVEAGADPHDALAETQWVEGIAEERGLPNGIVAFAALDHPKVDILLGAHAAHGRVRGIRHIVNWHEDPQRSYTAHNLTDDAAWVRGFALLAQHSLSFDLQCYPAQMTALASIFARHPDVPVIVNHMGMAIPDDREGMEQWRTGMRALAALPQVATKLSGPGFVRHDWAREDIKPLILDAIALFGVERCMFASDFPTDRLFGSFDRHLSAYHEIVADFSEGEKQALFAGNANRLYRLEIAL